MASIGTCCCEATCDCITEAELPAVSITGMTGGSWSSYGAGCCFEKTFTYNSAQSVTTACTTNRTETYHGYCKQNVSTRWDYRATVQGAQAICCPTYILAGYIESDQVVQVKHWNTISWKPYQIKVRVYRATITCGTDDPVCKYVIESQYYFKVRVNNGVETQTTKTYGATALSSCFQVVGTPGSTTVTTGQPVDCSEVSGIDSGTVYSLKRFKFLDSLPDVETAYEFTSSDFVSGCTSNRCATFDSSSTVVFNAASQSHAAFCAACAPGAANQSVTRSSYSLTCNDGTTTYHLDGNGNCVADITFGEDYTETCGAITYHTGPADHCATCLLYGDLAELIDEYLARTVRVEYIAGPTNSTCGMPDPCGRGTYSARNFVGGNTYDITSLDAVDILVETSCPSWSSTITTVNPAWTVTLTP